MSQTREGELVYGDHPGIVLLDDVIDALLDLDNGKPHPAFETAHSSRGASLPRKQVKRDQAMVEFLHFYKLIKAIAPSGRPKCVLEKAWKLKGVMRKSKLVDAVVLRNLRNHPRPTLK